MLRFLAAATRFSATPHRATTPKPLPTSRPMTGSCPSSMDSASRCSSAAIPTCSLTGWSAQLENSSTDREPNVNTTRATHPDALESHEPPRNLSRYSLDWSMRPAVDSRCRCPDPPRCLRRVRTFDCRPWRHRRHRRPRFANGFGVLAKLLRVAIDLPSGCADVCQGWLQNVLKRPLCLLPRWLIFRFDNQSVRLRGR